MIPPGQEIVTGNAGWYGQGFVGQDPMSVEPFFDFLDIQSAKTVKVQFRPPSDGGVRLFSLAKATEPDGATGGRPGIGSTILVIDQASRRMSVSSTASGLGLNAASSCRSFVS